MRAHPPSLPAQTPRRMPAGPAIKLSVRIAQVSVGAAAKQAQPSATHVGFTLMLGLHCWDSATLTLERDASCSAKDKAQGSRQ